ncbi:MAG TPA: TIGR02281 family clan AA aspartic protease [Burkholderiaceae bacterium]|nr:TIGR02281 family clan AA aspartic protease [Burkholderiaceae bacterium]
MRHGQSAKWQAGRRMMGLRVANLAAALLIALCSGVALGQNVALTGVMGERALLVIDDDAPGVLAPGQTRRGVTLISVGEQSAVIEIQGQRQTLRVGEIPVNVGAKGGGASGSRVVLSAGSSGHYFGTARINGVSVPFVVDTGASNVVMGVAQAEQIGINYRSGQRISVSTANGATLGYQLALDSVRVGEVEVFHVDATVVPATIPLILLGNSFLGRFQMKQENDLLVLERRY